MDWDSGLEVTVSGCLRVYGPGFAALCFGFSISQRCKPSHANAGLAAEPNSIPPPELRPSGRRSSQAFVFPFVMDPPGSEVPIPKIENILFGPLLSSGVEPFRCQNALFRVHPFILSGICRPSFWLLLHASGFRVQGPSSGGLSQFWVCGFKLEPCPFCFIWNPEHLGVVGGGEANPNPHKPSNPKPPKPET